MVRRQRRSRKGDILVSFTAMVAERGYDAVSLRDVAEELGMSKGTIVHHYGSKEMLLEALHHDYMRRRLDEAAAVLERLSDPAERLGALIYQLLFAQRDDRAATVAFAREISRFATDDSMADVRRMREEYFDLVRDVVRDGTERGKFSVRDATIVTFQVFGMCNWSWTWYRSDGPVSVDDIARSFIDTVLYGLVADGAAGFDHERVAAVVLEVMHEPPVPVG
jgi:AcrR family transcriptional regulator